MFIFIKMTDVRLYNIVWSPFSMWLFWIFLQFKVPSDSNTLFNASDTFAFNVMHGFNIGYDNVQDGNNYYRTPGYIADITEGMEVTMESDCCGKRVYSIRAIFETSIYQHLFNLYIITLT